MKKVLIIILLSLLMLPNLVKAERYDSAVKTANTYMLNSTYKNTYERYLTTGLGLYNGSTDNFELGGLLSNDEFKITLNNKQSEFSYLYDGFDYWTYTKKDNEVYVVSNEIDKLLEKENILPKTRVTEYIKSDVVVEGMGTRNNPWVFVPIYQITLKANEYGKLYLKKGETCSGGTPLENLSITYEGKNKKIDVCLLASDGYKYVSNTCSGFVSVKDDVLTINKVTKDLNCTVDFGKETYRIDLDQTNAETKSQPDKMYLVYTHGWYKDVTGLTNIVKLDQNPERTGYTFGGYQTTNADGKNVQVIDSDGKIINNDETLKLFNGPGKLNIIWTANKYRVTLNSGSDVTTTGTTNVEATYDSAMPAIEKPSKSYTVTFNGNGGSAGSSSLTSTYTFGGYYYGSTQYYTASGASARVWDKASATTLTASWSGGSITLPSATRSGYIFNGWYTATSGGTKIGNAGASYTPTAATTLYAQWTIACSSPTYSEVSSNPSSYYTYTGSSTLVKDGTGWYVKFTSSGTLSINKCIYVDLSLVGGGAGGNGGYAGALVGYAGIPCYAGAAGSGGKTTNQKNVTLNAGSSYSITIGDGGSGGASNGYGGSGGTTTFGSYSAAGGQKSGSICSAASGGSGGGAAGNTEASYTTGGNGGSNGSGGGSTGCGGGPGQGTSTYGFASSSYPLYSGGGGGGTLVYPVYAYGVYYPQAGGYGGSGNGAGGSGGRGGGSNSQNGESVSSNSGAGGGGGGCWNGGAGIGGNGGSGIVLMRNKR